MVGLFYLKKKKKKKKKNAAAVHSKSTWHDNPARSALME
jgi:hypothetical protein